MSQFVVGLGRLLEDSALRRFVLVFDGIDHQRDAPATLLPALARMGEIVSCLPSLLLNVLTAMQIPHLTTVFITTAPRPSFLHVSGVPHIHFPSYTKTELLSIISTTKPHPQLPAGATETKDLWTRFSSAVYDSLSKHSSRDILSFRAVCLRLWGPFIAPIQDGTYNSAQFSRLLVANRSLFQNESVLIPALISEKPKTHNPFQQQEKKHHGVSTQLPYYSRLLLVAAYLASFNAPRTDVVHFLKSATQRRRKKGGGTALSSATKAGVGKSRKISRKLLGPQAFVLERMLAIFQAIREDADGGRNGKGRGVDGSADVQMAIATLASLRLLVRIGAGAGDVLDAGSRWRIAVGWEVVRGVARSVGVEAEDYLAD